MFHPILFFSSSLISTLWSKVPPPPFQCNHTINHLDGIYTKCSFMILWFKKSALKKKKILPQEKNPTSGKDNPIKRRKTDPHQIFIMVSTINIMYWCWPNYKATTSHPSSQLTYTIYLGYNQIQITCAIIDRWKSITNYFKLEDCMASKYSVTIYNLLGLLNRGKKKWKYWLMLENTSIWRFIDLINVSCMIHSIYNSTGILKRYEFKQWMYKDIISSQV